MKPSEDTIAGKHVVDGGALLHRVHWQKGMIFKNVAEAYVSYANNNYGIAHVVFDGYDDTMSTKSNEHSRRLKSTDSSQNVSARQENEAQYSKEHFLFEYPQQKPVNFTFIRFPHKKWASCARIKGDADTKIVATALQLADESNIIVVADDTDVAVMLLYHWKDQLSDKFVPQERGKKFWSIKEAAQKITLKDHLLFIHAWSGCDLTSSILGKGKPSIIICFIILLQFIF